MSDTNVNTESNVETGGAESTAPEFKTIFGTNQPYTIIARKGDVVLAACVYPIVDGGYISAPDKTYLTLRLHSKRGGNALFTEEDAEQGVVQQDAVGSLDQFWPNVKFDDVNSKRAAAQVGMFVPVKASDGEQLALLLDEGKALDSLAAFLLTLADNDSAVLSRDEIKAWLVTAYAPVTDAIKKWFKAKKAFADKVASNPDYVAGFHSDQVPQSYGKSKKAKHNIGIEVEVIEDLPGAISDKIGLGTDGDNGNTEGSTDANHSAGIVSDQHD